MNRGLDYIASAHLLEAGGLLVYPTETLPAIGCLATNLAGIAAIYKIKKRSASKLLPLVAASCQQVQEWADLIAAPQNLIRAFWPGPLTLILPAKRKSVKTLGNKNGEIAIRVTSHPLAAKLAWICGQPLIATSANISGTDKILSPEFMMQLENSSLFCGMISWNYQKFSPLSSTIVKSVYDSEKGWEIKILRAGEITKEMLYESIM